MTTCEWPGKKSAKTKKKQVKKSGVSPTYSQQLKERKKVKKLTIDDVLNLMEAGGQQCLLVGPGGALGRKFGEKGGLLVLRLPLGPLEQLLLLRQLRSQPVALLRQPAALLLPDTQRGFGIAQLLLKGGVGL